MSSKPDRHNIDVFPWLRTLPVAPEYHPTLAEFQDPIAYIFKIEKEASRYGICKIVPPLPPASKKTVVANFNKSVSSNGELEPVFTTRQQQIGFCPRRGRPVRRSVWQSGELYTFQEFEVKAKAFEKSYLSKCGGKKAGGGGLSALEIETLYWQASVDKPFAVEYANDMPGSAFSASSGRKRREGGEGMTVGDTAWNMKGVARSALSLLRFMKEDIAGVTSPMVYVAMLFSWFAWHVEDHDLHSLNYLHTGAGKTWYGVPKEAAAAFEEVVRVHGYGGEINPLVTFATLGEKTTVMSPEIFVKAGIPCCRLVQNPGEFVVTFPRAYHSGFSHGFNCGEASNMAAPDWLSAAKEAAVRRASINYPPMVSHFQLLYDTIFELCSRLPLDVQSKPRSSRLKQKRRPEGETVIKQLFIDDIKASNQLLQLLGEGSPVVLQPQSSAVFCMYSKSRIGCLLDSRSNSPLRLFNQKEAISNARNDIAAHKSNDGVGGKLLTSAILKKANSTGTGPVSSTSNKGDAVYENNNALLSDQRLFSCVTCGILCFSCVAIIQPTEAAAKYLMSSDCSFFSDSENETKIVHGLLHASRGANTLNPTDNPGWMGRTSHDSVYDVHIKSSTTQYKDQYHSDDVNSENEEQQRATALDFLASAYGSSSDSEDNMIDSGPDYTDGLNFSKVSPDSDFECDNPDIRDPLHENDFQCASTPRKCYEGAVSPKVADSDEENHYERALESRNLGNRIFMGSNLAYLHSDKDSSRMHVFCLEHAMEVKKKLQPIGGTHILLLCHSDYPRVEVEAKSIGEELGLDHCWNETAFREAFEEDEKCIATALESAEDVSSNGDWAVKLGINLFYSASLSRSPLYSKQMPYNSVVYKAFGRVPPSESPAKSIDLIKGSCKRKKIVLAGKWCGKAWMSNQVHPLLQPPAVEDVQSENPLLHSAKTDSDSTQEVISAEGRRGDIAANPSSEAVGMKRQIVVYSRSNKKSRRTEAGLSVLASDPIDAGETFTHRQPRLYSRSKHKIKGDLKLKEEKTPVLYHRNKNVAKGSLASANETTSLRDLFKPNFEPFGSFVDDKVCGPNTRLRKRIMKPQVELEAKPNVKKEMSRKKTPVQKKPIGGKMKETDSKLKPQKLKAVTDTARTKSRKGVEGELQCDVEGCTMTFSQKQELSLHRQNICPVKGCGKTFFSHKYLLQHRRVHDDERPLKCPWKGCKMTFKWAWARTEHIRVHTGVRPYICAEPGCSQTFRFVSDFSRHKRKTGHSEKKTIKYLKNQAEI